LEKRSHAPLREEGRLGVSTQTSFTPGRENSSVDPFAFYIGAERYSENSYKRAHVAQARERDRDCGIPVVLRWKSIAGFDMDHFDRVGRYFVRQVALDGVAQLVGAERGSALRATPDEELRRKIRLFKDVQATREAAFEYTGKGEYGGSDVPARLGLGGLQDFTARA
jgi:hypothetical protein